MGQRSIRMPDVGEGVAEAEIVEWSVKVGDLVREDQVVAAVMTDKATVEIPTPVAGTVLALGGGVGDVLAVGSELIRIDAPGLPDCPPPAPRKGAAAKPEPPAPRPPLAARPAAEAAPIDAPRPAPAPVRRRRRPPPFPHAPDWRRRGPRAKGRSPRRRCARERAKRASICASCAARGPPGASLTTISTLISPARPRRRRQARGQRAEHGGRDDQGRRLAPAHRAEHGRIVATGRAFLLCRGGRRHGARGIARVAQRARDRGAAEADDAALPDARDRQGGRGLSRRSTRITTTTTTSSRASAPCISALRPRRRSG